jgi:hypothetical protein|tara:strand:+ start:17047 stop:17973 length:927 start_codon:yes stop_codon:yes gene_type:complete
VDKTILALIFLMMFILTGVKAITTQPNFDSIFHYNHSIGNYENFDGKHPEESYLERPKMVSWLSQIPLEIAKVITIKDVRFSLFGNFWFLLIFIGFPAFLYYVTKNYLVFPLFWILPTPYHFWFSGLYAQFLSTIIFIVHIKFLNLKGNLKGKALVSWLILIVGMNTHPSYLGLWILTLLIYIVWILNKVVIDKIILALIGIYSIIYLKILFLFTLFNNFYILMLLWIKPNTFLFYYIVGLLVAGYFFNLRILDFGIIVLFIQFVQNYKETTFKYLTTGQNYFFLGAFVLIAVIQLLQANTELIPKPI